MKNSEMVGLSILNFGALLFRFTHKRYEIIVTDPKTGHLEHIQINCNQTKHRTYFLKIFPYRACSDLSKNVCFKKNEGGEGGEKIH